MTKFKKNTAAKALDISNCQHTYRIKIKVSCKKLYGQ